MSAVLNITPNLQELGVRAMVLVPFMAKALACEALSLTDRTACETFLVSLYHPDDVSACIDLAMAEAVLIRARAA